MGDNLKHKTIHALKWSSVDRFGQQAIQLVVTLFLARLLGRADFGLLASIAVFTSLSFVLVESGFTQSLIRKQNADETDYSTVFYFNFFIAVALYILLFFALPLIARYFKQPDLVTLGRVLFVVVILTSLYLVPIAKLTKTFEFKTIAIINIIAVLIGGIGSIILAFNGFGVWALIIQQILFQLMRVIGYHIALRWKPRLVFQWGVIKSFWKFSINLLFTSVLNVLFNNIFVFILGRKYTIRDVGDYNLGNRLNETTNYTFQTILTSSSYPLFVQIQDDNERFRRVYRELSKKISIITFPVLLTLIAIAKPLVTVLLSEKWLPAIPYYQLLCAASLFSVLYALTISALNAKGQSQATLKIELIKKGLILLFLIAGFKFGIIPMLIGYAFANTTAYFVSVLYLKKEIQHYIKHQIIDFLVPFGVGIIIASICYSISFLIANVYLLFAVQLLVATALYIFWMWKFNTDIFNTAVNYLHKNVLNKFGSNN